MMNKKEAIKKISDKIDRFSDIGSQFASLSYILIQVIYPKNTELQSICQKFKDKSFTKEDFMRLIHKAIENKLDKKINQNKANPLKNIAYKSSKKMFSRLNPNTPFANFLIFKLIGIDAKINKKLPDTMPTTIEYTTGCVNMTGNCLDFIDNICSSQSIDAISCFKNEKDSIHKNNVPTDKKRQPTNLKITQEDYAALKFILENGYLKDLLKSIFPDKKTSINNDFSGDSLYGDTALNGEIQLADKQSLWKQVTSFFSKPNTNNTDARPRLSFRSAKSQASPHRHQGTLNVQYNLFS